MTELLDLVSAASGDDPGLDAASDLALGAGIVAALGAAVTGITDWSDVGGAHRRLGLAHGLMNVAGVTLNLGSLALRVGGNKRSRGMARVLSAAGYLTVAAAAYVGGELVFNLGMAINRDAWVGGPEKYTDVAAESDLQEGKMVKVELENRPIVLLKHDDGIHAFEGTCPHYGCDLWEGRLDGHIVTCPCHGSQFDVTDGHLVHGPATSPVPSYQVSVRQGRVRVRSQEG
jgi:nitrite reductase/ring-hydroxylating ferredoxin subunit